MPKLVVGMAARNADKFLAKALDSITDQTYHDWVLIIVDDASEDRTFDIATKWTKLDNRIQVFKNEEQMEFGPTLSKAYDLGIKLYPELEYLALHDADDYSEPTRFARQVAEFEKYPESVLIGTFFYEGPRPDGSMEKVAKVCSPEAIRHALTYYGTPFGHGTTMMRKKTWEVCRPYTTSMAQDVEFFQRVEDTFPAKMRNVPEYLYTHIMHPQMSSQTRLQEVMSETARIMTEAQARRKPLTQADFEEGRIKLDLGAGIAPAYGYLHLDAVAGPDIEIEGPITDVPLPDGSCEVVRLGDVLEHQDYQSVPLVLAEIRRLLAPKAKLLLNTPNLTHSCKHLIETKTADDQQQCLGELFGSQAHSLDYHLSGWTKELLEKWLADNGFTQIKFTCEDEGLSVEAVKKDG